MATVLALAGCALGVSLALPTYLKIRVKTATPKQIEDTRSPDGNYRLTDAFADLSRAIQDPETTEVYIPIRSISRPQDPVSIVMLERKYFLSELRSHPDLLKLEGTVSDWDKGSRKLPRLPVTFSSHIVGFYMGFTGPIGERDIANLGLGIGLVSLSILIWIRYLKLHAVLRQVLSKA